MSDAVVTEKKKTPSNKEKGLRTVAVCEWSGDTVRDVSRAIDSDGKYVVTAAVEAFKGLTLEEQFTAVKAVQLEHAKYLKDRDTEPVSV